MSFLDSTRATATERLQRALGDYFWSAYGAAYDLIWDSPLSEAIAESALEWAPPGASVVDLGCGTGLISRLFVSFGCEVHGVDSSRPMLRRALRRRRLTSQAWRPAEDTNLPNASADLVLICNVLHLHADGLALLAEAVRIAKPGATIFACWPGEGLSNDDLVDIELKVGRSMASTIFADLLRRMISLLAAVALKHPNRQGVRDLVTEAIVANSLTALRCETLLGCQNIIVLKVPEQGAARSAL